MDNLVLFNKNDLKSLLKNRSGESKFGKHIHLLSNFTSIYDEILSLDVTYVIFGIKEDIGVFANYGTVGTSGAWDATLKSLLNIQSNDFTHPKKVLLLGHLDYSKSLEKLKELNQNQKKHIQKARKKVAKIDKDVSELVFQIVKAGKIPIIIGGGHNNAYGNIKGTSLALKEPINVVNFDAHSDFRVEEGRHSGNGFTYALHEGFLNDYYIFGLHENYTSQEIFISLDKNKQIHYNTFESVEVRKERKFKKELENALEVVSDLPFGVEFDCDAVENIKSSAMTPSGFSATKARRFIHYFAQNKNAKYLHICEASPTPETEVQIGKFITYLITDFIRANAN
ncbi:formiminoglutamase [Flavobacteriaceae bacterium MAR_2010_72]|nr:formiminoglutamase [Flavobacteriaceae bacterium MAR_2010_72]TVZ59562.1 formiminoglutamase [Flavobacteriaceae bacterium MAR_2010_105]